MREDFKKKPFKKMELRWDRYIKEYRFRIKDTDEEQVEEEVFDKKTLMNLYKLSKEGYIEEMYGVVASGKEARIYSGIDKDNNPIAIKIFLTLTSEFRRSRLKYIIGDPRFEGTYGSALRMVYIWASKEYKNLKEAFEAGVYVPKPMKQYKNILIMEFIGKEFVPAPTLKEYNKLNIRIFHQALKQIKILYNKADLVHADLSEYNIFYYNRKTILFDFGQAVVKEHPMAEGFLIRDIGNIYNFFKFKGITPDISLEEAISYVKGD